MTDIATLLQEIVGPRNVQAGREIEGRYRQDFLKLIDSSPAYVVRPSDTAQVVEIVKVANRTGMPIVPLGGGTGTCGGTACRRGEIVLSLERMHRILELDEDAMTITVEAGITLQALQDRIEASELLLPLDLGSRGSATIGGTIATNAGGLRVLRWGMMRDMVIGIEAVLADGSIVSRMQKTLKDNAGYDWKHLLIGSEGTLGIVTKAILRLRPLPCSSQTALLAIDNVRQASDLLRFLQRKLGGQLSSFELMWRDFFEVIGTLQLPQRPLPMESKYPLYLLVESLGYHPDRDRELFEEALTEIYNSGTAHDIVIAQSEKERQNLWALRDDLAEPLSSLNPVTGFDISISLLQMNDFVDVTNRRIRTVINDAVMLHYGHAGDGNMHIIVSGKDLNDPSTKLRIETLVYDTVREFSGSIAAEHGIGLSRVQFLDRSRSGAEIALMEAVKKALDPNNLFNPGKILAVADR